MNAPIKLAQATTPGAAEIRTVRLEKPADGKAVLIQLSTNQTIKVDFSGIAKEKIIIVRIGERAVILFENGATITLDPFWDSLHRPLANLQIESNGEIITPTQFALLFPTTIDQSVLPAAGEGNDPQDAGANFSDPTIDLIFTGPPLDLLPPTELGTWEITKDVAPNLEPSAGPNPTIVIDEDNIDTAFSDGNDDNPESPGDDDPLHVTGTLNFTPGDPTTTVGFQTMDGDPIIAKDSDGNTINPVQSQGHNLVYVWDAGASTLKAVWADDQTHVVFQMVIDPNTGDYTFSLFDQLDHPFTDADLNNDGPDLGFEDNLLVDLTYTVTDGNGDTANGKVTVNFDDDMPALKHHKDIRFLNEDDIDTGAPTGSDGTSPNDGDFDGSFTGNPPANDDGPATVFGSLTDTVRVGADEHPDFDGNTTGIVFSFVDGADATAALAALNGLGLESKDDAIVFSFDGSGDLVGEAGGRLVIKLILESNGDYAIELHDQVDHDPPYDNFFDFPILPGDVWPLADQNLDLQDGIFGDVVFIDFGALIKAEDYDGDAIILDNKLLVSIVDDIPEIKHHSDICLTVDEDDIATGAPTGSDGNHPNDGDGDGSFTGNPPGNDTGPAFVSGSLASMVVSGADEPITFSFIVQGGLGEHIVTGLAELAGLSSKGEHLDYDIQGDTLYAYVNGGGGTDGYEAGDRLVFKFVLESDGDFTFELHDQLDHDPPHDDFLPFDLADGLGALPGSDENFDLHDHVPFFDVAALPLGFLVQATDYDGDSVIIGDNLTIKIRDDVPELKDCEPICRTVDEDDIKTGAPTGSDGNHPSDGPGDGSLTGPVDITGPATVTGSLAGLVSVGADEPLTFSFIVDGGLGEHLLTELAELVGLSSKGEDLDYDIQGNILYGYVNGGVGTDGYEATDRLVFKFTLQPNGDYSFELHDQLDHDPPNEILDDLPGLGGSDENFDLLDNIPVILDVEALPLGFLIQATDYDGDSVCIGDQFSIKIRDDVPELKNVPPLLATVDEDDVDTGTGTPTGSKGNSPNDGNADGSYTGNPAGEPQVDPASFDGPATITGSLAGLVSVGADEPPTFSFLADGGLAEDILLGIAELVGFSSKGEELDYDIQGNVLYGYVNGGVGTDGYEVTDRLVFKFTLQPNGDYSFELHDQIDHDPPNDIIDDLPGLGGSDENFDLQDNIPLIDFEALPLGLLIQATDYDGDSVTLGDQFSIRIRDDVPVLKNVPGISHIVDEDDIDTILAPDALPGGSTGTSPEDGNGDGSFTGGPSDDGDNPAQGEGPAFVSGSVAGQVSVGADEDITFSFNNPLGDAVQEGVLAALGLKSQGANIKYDFQGNVLFGYVGAGDYDPTDRLVFKFTIQPNGDYSFELHDQVDHDPPNDVEDVISFPGSDENFDLVDGIPFVDITTLDFGSLIKATDYDGDSVGLNGRLNIQIRDDIPVTTGQTASIRVEEDELSTVLVAPTVDLTTGIPDGDLFTDEATFTAAQLAALVNVGADEPVNFDLKAIPVFGANPFVQTTGNVTVTSEGVNLRYANGPVAGTIIGYADANGNGQKGAIEREVFRLTDNGDGTFTFDLKDKIDHLPLGGNNDGETLNIDLTSLFIAEDFDHDQVTLLADSIYVEVENDVPLIGDCTILVNGSFETGHNLLGSDWEIFASLPPPGWVQGGDGIPFEVQRSGAAGPGINAQDGNAFVELDSDTDGNPGNPLPDINLTPNTNATIQQTVVTDPGQMYELHFWYMPRPEDGNADSSSMEVLWEGAVVHTIDSSTALPAWQLITLHLTAVDASSILGFRGTGQQNELGAFIDNVRLCAIGAVDEDGLEPPDLSDGIGDSQIGDIPGNATVATGSLLITWGADDFDQADGASQDSIGSDRSVTFTNNTVDIGGIVGPLMSQGDLVNFILTNSNTRLEGRATDGRLVFEVKLFDDNSGSFRFELFDQLDHASGDNENDITLEFNFTAKDSDGDTALGDFKILVDDDLPTTKEGAYKSFQVDEDELVLGDNGDLATGNTDNPPDTVTDEVIFSTANLNTLINVGADEPLIWTVNGGFPNDANEVRTIGGDIVTSLGVTLKYASGGAGIVIGYADSNGDDSPAGEREVFRLTDLGGGNFQFDLKDKIDHPPLNAGGGDLETLTIDLTPVFSAEDFDHDKVTLEADSIRIVIENDIPIVPVDNTNYITNGDFIAGTWVGPFFWGSYALPGNVPGWTIGGDPTDTPDNPPGLLFERPADGYLDLSSTTDGHMIDLGASGGNYQLSQQVGAGAAPDLVAGQKYVIEFEVGAPFPASALLEVYWGGVLIGTIDTNVSSGELDKYAFLVDGGVAPADNTILLKEVGSGNADVGNDGNGNDLLTERWHGTYVTNFKMLAVDAWVDEDGLISPTDFSQGNHDSQLGDAVVPNNDGDNDESTALSKLANSLGIQWGADDGGIADNSNDGPDQDGVGGPPGLTGRSVTFANNLVEVFGTNDLKSQGDDVTFVIDQEGTRLRGIANDGFGDRTVFEVELFDDGSGAFTFQLFDQLDHAVGANENDIALRFNFRATDSDGDFVDGSFLVGVDDDVPVALDDKDFVEEGKNDGVKNTTSGNVITGIDPDPDPENILLQADQVGADEPPSICTVKHGDVTYSLDDANPQTGLLTIETALGGKLEIQMTGPNAGQYTYTAPCQVDNPAGQSLFTVSVGNVPAGVQILAFDPTAPNPSNPGDVLPVVGKGFGVASPGPGGGDDDGSGEPRFDEINHTSAGTSETLIFKLDGDAVATKANVDLSFFFGPAEAGVGSERGHWEAFLNGVSVGSADFTATSPSGDSSTVLSVGGCAFDEIRFTALIGTADASGQGDSSDYYVKQIEFINEPPVSESFEYALKDYDGDKDKATLTIKIGDGGPGIEVDPQPRATITLALDETHQSPVGVDTYNAAIGETESLGGPPNGDLDDVGAGPDGTNPFGAQTTAPGALFGLFNVVVDPGPDPVTVEYEFSLLLRNVAGSDVGPGVGVETTLSVIDPSPYGALTNYPDPTIYLFKEPVGSDPDVQVITGRVGNNPAGEIAFRVTLTDDDATPSDPNDATLKVEQILPISHNQHLLDAGFVFNAATGNYYKLVDGDFSWSEADAAATGMGGYLATITSAQENAFIAALFDNNAATSPDGAWLGGGDTAVEGVYRWLTGPEAGNLFTYTNWEQNALPFPQQEPNDAQFPGDDDYVTIGRFDTSFSGDAGTWNDDGDPSHGGARGYIVEISGNKFDEQAFLDIFGDASNLGGIVVALTGTVTENPPDNDSDSDSAEVNVTGAISLDDDGPTAVLTFSSPTIIYDETAGIDLGSHDAPGTTPYPVPPAGLGTLIGRAAIAGWFQSTGSDFGTDGAAAVNPTPPPVTPIGFSLAISAPGVDSGIDTVDGRSIFLYVENNLVVGRPETTIGSGAPGLGVGPVAIVLAVNGTNGNFSVNQYIAIKHADPLDPDESGLPETFDAGTVFGRVRVADADGDAAIKSIDISQLIRIEDDGPSINQVQVLDFDDVAGIPNDGNEGPLNTLAPNYGGFTWAQVGVFNPDPDNLSSLHYATHSENNLAFFGEASGPPLDIAGYPGAAGSPIIIERADAADFTFLGAWFSSTNVDDLPITVEGWNNGGLVWSTTISVDEDGPFFFDFTGVAGFGIIDSLHLDAPNYFGFDDFTYILNPVAGLNDIPVIIADEDDLNLGAPHSDFQGNDDLPTPSFGDDDAFRLTGTLGFNAGTDGLKSINFASMDGVQVFDVNGIAVTSGGAALFYSWDAPANTLYAYVPAPQTVPDSAVFKITVNPLTGAYTFTLLERIDHPAPLPPADPAENKGENNIDIDLTYTVTDGDNDTATGKVRVSIDDDVPVAANDTDDVGTSNSATGNVIFGTGSDGNPAGTDSPGADGGKITHIQSNNPGGSGLTAVDADGVIINGQFGTLNIEADGDYTYTRTSVLGGTDTFTYTLTDGDGDPITATLAVDLDPQTPPPGQGEGFSAAIEEDQLNPASIGGPRFPILATGIEDEDDVAGLDTDEDATPGPQEFNNITHWIINDDNSLGVTGGLAPLDFHFVVPNGTQALINGDVPLTSEGAAVLYHTLPDGNTLIGYAETFGGAGYQTGDRVVFDMLITNETGAGQFNFVLYDNIDHHPYGTTVLNPAGLPIDDVENFVALNLNGVIEVTDANGDDFLLNGEIRIIDDIPITQGNSRTVAEGTISPVDIQFVVDMSGSMFPNQGSLGFDVPGFDNDRAGLARYSMLQMLQNNPQIINVEFVKFGSTATASIWMSNADAITYIQTDANWTDLGNTNYDLALEQAIDVYDDVRPLTESPQTFVYFLSDGNPNDGGGITDNVTITPAGDGSVTIADWEAHIAASGIDAVFAVGIGGGVSVSNLEPISFPNTDTDPADGDEDNVVIVSTANVTDLLDTLQELLTTASINGNVLENDPPLNISGADSFGADGPLYVTSLGHDSDGDGVLEASDDHYTFNGTGISLNGGAFNPGTEITFDTFFGGEFHFNFLNGEWDYTTPDTVAAQFVETIGYKIADGDGDESAETGLFITVQPANDAPVISLNNIPVDANYRDEFGAAAYDNTNGSTNWQPAPWTESSDSGGAASGTIRIASNELRFGADGDSASIVRTVNLAGATSATLAFNFQDVDTESDDDEELVVSFAADGITFVTLATYDSGDADGLKTLNLTGPFAADSKIRFAVSELSSDSEWFAIDNVNVAYSTVSTPTFTEGGAPAKIMPTVSIADPDNPVNFNTGFLTVSLAGAVAGDQLVLTNDLGASVVGANVFIGATDIGDVTAGGFGGTSVTITFDTDASDGFIETLMRSIAFSSISDNPTNASRTANITFNDGGNTGAGGPLFDTEVVTINVVPVNDLPTATDDSLVASEAQVATNGSGSPFALGNIITGGTADSDPDGGTLEVQSIALASVALNESNANIALDGGGIISEGTGAGEVAQFRIRIDNSNPTLADQDAHLEIDADGDVRIWSDSGEDPFRGLAAGQSATITFTYTLEDNQGGTDPGNVTITINGSNDAPTATNLTSNSNYNEGAASVALSDIVVTDADAGDTITATLTLNNTATGSLSGGGGIYNAGTGIWSFTGTVAAANAALAAVVFNPNVNNDVDTTITTRIRDAANTGPVDGSITLNATGVNDAPQGLDNTINLVEDVSYVFNAADFGFSDPLEGNAFAGVVINGVPAGGTLRLGNTTVVNNDFITVAAIAAGSLIYAPADNSLTDRSFTFSVRDNGGTANGGQDTDGSPNTMTLDMSATNFGDTVNAGTGTHTQVVTLGGSNFSIIDNGSSTGDRLRLDTAAGGATVLTDLDFFRTDNNLEASWTSGGVSKVVTALDQYVAAAAFEFFHFDEGGTYAGYVLSNADYILDQDVTGGATNDILAGTAAGQTMDGGAGADLVFGNGGDDTLIGGTGLDLLVGGLGSNTYEWNATSESGNTIATADVVVGFDADDILDVNGIDANSGSGGNQNFTFGGNDATVDANEIAWFESGGNTIIHLDTNGAVGAEMMFVLTGVGLGLTSGDFNL